MAASPARVLTSCHVILVGLLLLGNVVWPEVAAADGQEVLKNHDMEVQNLAHNWYCQSGCHANTSNDRYSGWHSVMVTHRRSSYSGLAQAVSVTGGQRFNFTAYIKLLNLEAGAMYQTAELIMACTGSNGHKVSVKFGHEPYVHLGEWTLIGGLHQVHAGVHGCHVFVQVLGSHVNYLVDHASLRSVADEPNWRAEAEARIETLRKSDFTLRVSGIHNHAEYTVEVSQVKHKFGFGSAVGASHMIDPALHKYQQAFYDNFEWAVLENALKWKQIEKAQGHVDYSSVTSALHALASNGTLVRGHNVFWDIQSHSPSWLASLSRHDLLVAMDTRLKSVVGHTKGWVEHWDVNNEAIHGDYFEKATANINATMDMFRDVHAVDPAVKLFLNDFGVMENWAALPLRNQAVRMKNAGAPVYGVGIQSHLYNMNLDIPTLKGQLDMVAEAGLPIWITELSLSSANENVKASALQDILTLYFSHPAIEGVLFWGFWDGKLWKPEMALFEGPEVTPNAAGRKYQQLFKTTWRTQEKITLHSDASLSLRGFKGTYNVIVTHGGHEVMRETFTLGDTAQTINVNIGSNGGIVVG